MHRSRRRLPVALVRSNERSRARERARGGERAGADGRAKAFATDRPLRRAPFAAVTLLALLPAPALAAVTAFTDRAVFDAVIAGHQDVQVLDFDGIAAGTTIPSGSALGGVTFSYSIEGFDLRVIDVFGTTSGTHSLGLTADDVLLSGDAFTISFDRTVHAAGVYVIGEELAAGDFELRLSGGDFVANGAVPDMTLPDGEAFFLGLVESDPAAGFTSVELASLAPPQGEFAWNADDVVTGVAVPEPGGGAATAAAMAALCWRARRRRSHLG